MEIKKSFFILVFSFFSSLSFCHDEIINSIRSSLEKNPGVQEIMNDFNSMKIYKKQYDYQWFPSLQLDFPESVTLSRGDSFAIMNQKPNPQHTIMLNPTVRLSLQQKLPGNGSFSISSGYRLYFLPERKYYLQLPFFSASINQTISKDSFKYGNNSEVQLIKVQMEYGIFDFRKKLFSQLKEFINLLSEYDILCSEISYYQAQVEFYTAKTNSAEEKNKNGLQSNLELYYARHSLQNNNQQLKNLEFQKNDISQKIQQLYDTFDFSMLDENRDFLMDFFDSEKQDFVSDKKIYENIIMQNSLIYNQNELSFKPQFYFSAQVNPDTNIYYQYSDWNKSWRSLVSSPLPINVNSTIGLVINFELPKAKTMRKEIYELEQENVRNQMLATVELQKKAFDSNAKEINNLSNYYHSLKEEFESENSFRTARKEMFEEQIITQEDFLESEITYFIIREDYIKTFWSIIKKQLDVIEISSDFEKYINLFFDTEDLL